MLLYYVICILILCNFYIKYAELLRLLNMQNYCVFYCIIHYETNASLLNYWLCLRRFITAMVSTN